MHHQWINLLVLSKVWSVLRNESAQVRKLDPPLFSFLLALAHGKTLGEAMSESALYEAGLRDALHFIFTDGLVTSLATRA